VSPDGQDWIATRPGFFLPVRVLSRHLRQLFHEALRKKHPELFALAPAQVWEQEWVVNCIDNKVPVKIPITIPARRR
jgi:hypothetical protein